MRMVIASFALAAALPLGLACAQPEGAPGLLYDNGGIGRQGGVGFGGADISRIEARFNTYGFTSSTATNPNFTVGDDFIVPANKQWTPASMDVYAYQTTTATSVPPIPNTTPTISAAYVTVWRGNPAVGGVPVAGDFTTNRMSGVSFANCWRLTETDPAATVNNRAIMKVSIDLSWLGALEAGHYWVGIKLTGTQTPNSGPFLVPVVPQRDSDNAQALNGTTNVWNPLSGNGGLVDSDGNQDISYQLYGTETDSSADRPPYGWQYPPMLNIRHDRSVKIRVKAVGGTNPASTGLSVHVNLGNLSLGGDQALFDDGTNGDDAPGDGIYTFVTGALPNTVATGVVTLPCTVSDDQSRTDAFTIVYIVNTGPNEIEANGNKFTANYIPMTGSAPTNVILGTSSNTGTAADTDYFLVATPPVNGIMRHRLTLNAGTLTYNVTSATQTNGIINPNGTVLFAAPPLNGDGLTRTAQWYSHGGSNDPKVYIRVLGTTALGTVPYSLTLVSDPVTPVDIGHDFEAGPITLTSVAQGHSTETEVWVYDANFAPIAEWGNDDTPNPFADQFTLTRDFTPGTYYLAVSNFNLANHLPNAFDDNSRSSSVMDFPGVTGNGSATVNLNVAFSIHDGGDSITPVAATKTDPFQVLWFKMNVVTPTVACSIADIATEGNPDVQAGPDGFITGVDADAFIECFNNLTRKALPSDPPGGPYTGPYIADVIGDLGVGPPNGFVEGVDADAFFEAYFIGC